MNASDGEFARQSLNAGAVRSRFCPNTPRHSVYPGQGSGGSEWGPGLPPLTPGSGCCSRHEATSLWYATWGSRLV